MRHIVNLALLFAIGSLIVTGALGFSMPFSVATARVHVFSGIVTVLLVACHAFTKIPYFRKLLQGRISGFSKTQAFSVASVSVALASLAIIGWAPLNWVLEQSYESRNRNQIFRASSLAGFGHPASNCRVVARKLKGNETPELTVLLNFQRSLMRLPSMVVWAESTSGTIIETLFLEEDFAFGEQVQWRGNWVRRGDVLPIWRQRYTSVSGATQNHQFALDEYLSPGRGNRFVICAEINASADPNSDWTDPVVGQPSLLYTALVDVDSESHNVLLELTGYGGTANSSGETMYDLETITTAKNMADLFLVKLEN